jgi:hypothetical protein
MIGSNQPETISIPDARARLEAADFQRMEGSSDPRFEIWLDPQGSRG